MAFGKKQTETTGILFSKYIAENKISSRKDILKVLMNNSFVLRNPYDDGNNYARFLDKEGYLQFNNPNMEISAKVLSSGVVTPDGYVGNTLRYENLLLVEKTMNKTNILDRIIKIEEEEKQLAKEKEELDAKLSYLISINSDVLDFKDFEAHKKEVITSKLLMKKTGIASVK
jgi:hypothetical protein